MCSGSVPLPLPPAPWPSYLLWAWSGVRPSCLPPSTSTPAAWAHPPPAPTPAVSSPRPHLQFPCSLAGTEAQHLTVTRPRGSGGGLETSPSSKMTYKHLLLLCRCPDVYLPWLVCSLSKQRSKNSFFHLLTDRQLWSGAMLTSPESSGVEPYLPDLTVFVWSHT